ncbi:MAG TPA: hypothetical protein VN702_20915 [Acetobacteraceae bacterium]|nr:hypothetical protein [Acetobacteraceae bacterium]
MSEPDRPDPQFNAMTNRLLRREALRRAAQEINTTSGPGLEGVLAQISAEVTAEAVDRLTARKKVAAGRIGTVSTPRPKSPLLRPSKP